MSNSLENRLKTIIETHLLKVTKYDPFYNFAEVENNKDFISVIEKDPAFSAFNLNREKYAIARFGGNLITSLHRKIGDIYEELTKEILSTKLSLSRESLEYSLTLKINNEIQKRSTDGKILIKEIDDKTLRDNFAKKVEDGLIGIALEVRSCYQIGDSKRIQADRDMALALREIKIEPVMLVFCITSLKSPVIRLKQYWNLNEGMDSFNYLKDISGFNLYQFLEDNKSFIKPLMDKIFQIF